VRAAVLRELGSPPGLDDFDEPSAEAGQAVVEVAAAGINPVDLAIASGKFYGGSPAVPSIVGREGIAALPDGGLAYFDGPVPPYGSMAERTVVADESVIPLPEGLDPALAVCFGIAGLAAWLALDWRAELEPGETVLVLGASGPVGQIAVQAARLLGAGRVVAAARSADGLARAQELGADATVRLGEDDDLVEAFRSATDGGPDVVVDPLWGKPALAAIQAASMRARLVQIGQSAGAEATIPSAAVRGKLLAILGHTNFAAPPEVKRAAFTRMSEHAAVGELTADFERVPLAEVTAAWERQASMPHRKLVLIP
jgi:NADPH2:quinone reductase